METVLHTLTEQIAAQSIPELVAVILAVAYVFLAARENIWCWPAALISTAIYSWLFWSVTLPFNSALNVYYLLMAVYGWMKWSMHKGEPMEISSWPLSYHLIALFGLTTLSLLLSQFATEVFAADSLYLDAFVTVFSVFTTVMVAHKVLENWLYWIVINCFAAWLYYSKGLYLTALLHVSYFAFALYGYVKWRAEYRRDDTSSAPLEQRA